MRERKAEEQKKRQLILKRVRATLLRLIRGHYRKKCLVWGVPRVSGTLGNPTVISTQPDGVGGPHPQVQALIDWSNHIHSISLTCGAVFSCLEEKLSVSECCDEMGG